MPTAPPRTIEDAYFFLLLCAVAIIVYFLKRWYESTDKKTGSMNSVTTLFGKIDHIIDELGALKASTGITAEKVSNTEKMVSEIKKESIDIDKRLRLLELDHSRFHGNNPKP